MKVAVAKTETRISSNTEAINITSQTTEEERTRQHDTMFVIETMLNQVECSGKAKPKVSVCIQKSVEVVQENKGHKIRMNQ